MSDPRRVSERRVIDINSQRQIVERRAGAMAALGADDEVRAVYRSGGGLQIGCTFVSAKAMHELIRIWKEQD